MLSRIITSIILPKNQIFRRYAISKANNITYKSQLRKIYKETIRTYTQHPKTPDLIYIPHIFRWVKTKFQFKYLQRTCDPEFTEGAFIFGTSKAVCRITEIIHEDRPEELDELLTPSARLKLKQDMKTKLTKLQKTIIKLKPEDIKILVPINVNLRHEGPNKICRVGMRVLALKWMKPNNGPMRLVLVAIQTEFSREYKQETVTDWNISAFDVLECVVLSTSTTYG
ncbi:uncharacterized protein LOC130442587 [Diorhabda sublineata]|uniref:uncharacterized protein LOC130442587 n=1 Tax=Diorhabda sublineata TaxID=1163346 RepID=UPI0024E12DB7|nr:uncharacterized protein LOC130442587 [Diorhabda sublineata]